MTEENKETVATESNPSTELYERLASKLFKLKEGEWAEAKQTEDFSGEGFIERKFERLINVLKTNETEKIGKAVKRAAERKEREFYEGLGLKYEGQQGDDYFATIKDHLGKKADNGELKNKYNDLIREKSEWLQKLEVEKAEIEKRISSKYENILKGQHVSRYVDKNVLSRKDLALTEDSDVNGYRIELLKKALLDLNTNVKEDGSIELLDENGELLRNSKHHVVTFEETVEDLLRKTIGISKSSPKQSTGITTAGSSTTNVSAPKDLNDFNAKYSELIAQGKNDEARQLFQEFKNNQ